MTGTDAAIAELNRPAAAPSSAALLPYLTVADARSAIEWYGDVFGAEQVGHLPAGLDFAGPAHQDQPGPPGQSRPQAVLCLVVADEDQRGGSPAGPGGCRVGGDLHLDASGGGEPEEIVEQVTVRGDDQRRTPVRRDGGTGWHRGLQAVGAGSLSRTLPPAAARMPPRVADLWITCAAVDGAHNAR